MANILIIDDDRLLSRGVVSALRKEGHVVYAADSLEEGKDIELHNELDLLLLDIELLKGDRVAMNRWINELDSSSIVFFTSNDTEVEMVRGNNLQYADYLAKPFSIEILKYKILAMLRRMDQPYTSIV